MGRGYWQWFPSGVWIRDRVGIQTGLGLESISIPICIPMRGEDEKALVLVLDHWLVWGCVIFSMAVPASPPPLYNRQFLTCVLKPPEPRAVNRDRLSRGLPGGLANPGEFRRRRDCHRF